MVLTIFIFRFFSLNVYVRVMTIYITLIWL